MISNDNLTLIALIKFKGHETTFMRLTSLQLIEFIENLDPDAVEAFQVMQYQETRRCVR